MATLEHVRDFDDPRGRPSLFARILRIAEAYDTLMRKDGGGMHAGPSTGQNRGPRRDSLRPGFGAVVGQCLGLLSTGYGVGTHGRPEWVQVRSAARTPESWDQPLCQLLHDPNGYVPMDEEVMVDLAEEGEVKREINLQTEWF